MTVHYWGSEDFDWEALNKAMDYITKESIAIGLVPIMKEKYGTIRYEFHSLWKRELDGSLTDLGIVTADAQGEHPTKEDLDKFEGILKAAQAKYPSVAEEIVEDWYNPFGGREDE